MSQLKIQFSQYTIVWEIFEVQFFRMAYDQFETVHKRSAKFSFKTINQNDTFCEVKLFNLQENSQNSENIPAQKFPVLKKLKFYHLNCN